MSTLYPSGYGTRELPLAELMALHMPVDVVEPEFRRRIEAFIVSKGGALGFGDILPRRASDGVSAASLGNRSFHQLQTFRDGTKWSCAIDTVVRRGGGLGHSSGAVPWAMVPVQGSAEAELWGVHANIGVPGKGESWHLQPVEIDGYWGWSARLRPRPTPNYWLPAPPVPTVLPGPPVVPPPPVNRPIGPRPWPVFNPALGMFGLFPFSKSKPELREGAKGDVVRYLQGVMRLKAGQVVVIDGDFGPQTELAVRNIQRFFGKTVDGRPGPETWSVIDFLAGT